MEGIVKYCVKINEVIDHLWESLGERKMRSNGEWNVSIFFPPPLHYYWHFSEVFWSHILGEKGRMSPVPTGVYPVTFKELISAKEVALWKKNTLLHRVEQMVPVVFPKITFLRDTAERANFVFWYYYCLGLSFFSTVGTLLLKINFVCKSSLPRSAFVAALKIVQNVCWDLLWFIWKKKDIHITAQLQFG